MDLIGYKQISQVTYFDLKKSELSLKNEEFASVWFMYELSCSATQRLLSDTSLNLG